MPEHIRRKYFYWLNMIEAIGLREVRKLKGLHDEALMGKRFGQRSVRLSKSYRAIYRKLKEEGIQLMEVIEVNKHDY